MPIETWQAYKPEPANLQPKRGQQIAHGDNIALAHTINGAPQQIGTPINAGVEGAAPAGRYNSTAPYGPAPQQRPPRGPDRAKRCYGSDDTCGAWATATGYCYGHSRALRGDVPVAEDT